MTSSPVVQYVSFGEHLLSASCQLISVSLMSRLLFFAHFRPNRLRVKGFSPTMHLYLMVHCTFSLLGIKGLPYLLYKLIWWLLFSLPNGPGSPSPYSPHLLFWTGIFELSYVTTSPIPVIFLCLERSLTLKLAESGTHRLKALLFFAGIVTIFVAWLASFTGYLTELPLDLTKVSQCMLMSCQLIKYRATIPLLIKVVSGLISLVLSSVFMFMLYRFGTATNLKNRIIKWTIIAAILFDVLPGTATFTFNKITGINLSHYIGEMPGTLCALDVCISAIVYWRILIKKAENSNLNGHNAIAPTEFPQQKSKVAKPSIWITPVNHQKHPLAG